MSRRDIGSRVIPIASPAGGPARPTVDDPVDVLVSTFNSARYLEPCLAAARKYLPVDRLLIADHASTDGTLAIAESFGAEVQTEDRGLAHSRNLLLRAARTPFVVFLDSDVIIRRPDFWNEAVAHFERRRVGAVVGLSVGRRYLYGLPFGLTLLPREWARRVELPDDVQARETYFFQRAMRRDRRSVAYVLDAMEHRSQFRGHKPEWEGAGTRRVAGFSPRELVYSFMVILMIHMNTRTARGMLYTPIFCAKFLRGYTDPKRWEYLDRRIEPE